MRSSVLPLIAASFLGLLASALLMAGSAPAANFTTVPVRLGTAPADNGTPWEPAFISTEGLIPANVNVTNRAGAQSETSVAVDPTDANHILCAMNDLASTAAVYERGCAILS